MQQDHFIASQDEQHSRQTIRKTRAHFPDVALNVADDRHPERPAELHGRLLLKFRSRDAQFGVTRKTVKAMAKRFDLSETEVVHMALSRLAQQELPAYEADERPLSARDLRALRKIADGALPKGRIVKRQPLF